MARRAIRQGQWWLPRLTAAPPRQILKIGPGKDHQLTVLGVVSFPVKTYVYYGTGGGRHRFCLEKTFQAWIDKTAAKRGVQRSRTPLELRGDDEGQATVREPAIPGVAGDAQP